MNIVVIDDERTFDSDLPVRYARTGQEGLALLADYWTLQRTRHDYDMDELYLDHDLGPEDEIRPCVAFLEAVARLGQPFNVGTIFVHTQNPVGAEAMIASLSRYYNTKRITLPVLAS